MIPEIKNILYTTDLSTNARYAFGYAASLAEKYDAKITILNVLEYISESMNNRLKSMMGEDRWEEIQARNEKEALSEIHDRLTRFCGEMKGELIGCSFIVDEILVEHGVPVEQILRHIDSNAFDLVVMGTHGHGVLADAMMGSTARRVARRSNTPVMVIRLPEEE